MKPESKIKADCRRKVRAAGGEYFAFKSPGRRNVPDDHYRFPYGVEFYVEFKAPGKKPTEAQLAEHNRLRSLGARVFVSDSKVCNVDILDEMYKPLLGV